MAPPPDAAPARPRLGDSVFRKAEALIARAERPTLARQLLPDITGLRPAMRERAAVAVLGGLGATEAAFLGEFLEG